MDLNIGHDKLNQKFFIIIDEKEAFLRYRLEGNKKINLIKTYVPPELRGKRIAEKIVMKGMEYARENNLHVIPTCSYIETFLLRHNEYRKLVDEF